MTSAQKLAKEKFKKAIAYRQKSGVSLKEAFAHVYGKKKVARKKIAKKRIAGPKDSSLVRKELARKGLKMPHGYTTTKRKRSISGSSDYYTRKKEGRVIPRKTKHKKATKKKPTERAVLKSIQNAVKVQKSHMGSLHKTDHTIITKYKNNIEEIAKQNQYLMQWQYALKQQHTKANKIICRNRINEIKKYISELKIHARELKKLLK